MHSSPPSGAASSRWYAGVAQPTSYETFAGLVWLAVVVTMGVRSITAAALSGLAFALLPSLVQTYLPSRWWETPALLFGLGAISVARHPEGVVLHFGQQLRALPARVAAMRHDHSVGSPPVGELRTGEQDAAVAVVTTDASDPRGAAVR